MYSELANFTITRLVFDSRDTMIYRGYRDSDKLAVLLKTQKKEYPPKRDIVRARNEFEILSKLKIDGVPTVYSLEPWGNRIVLVLQDTEGQTLKEFLQGKALSLGQFFPLALSLTEIVGHLHLQHISHNLINPFNILLTKDKLKPILQDYQAATAWEIQDPSLLYSPTEDERLVYISPEQTGRLKQRIDHRTDLYSLGLVLYEMLAGQSTFQSKDSLELVHCHLAKLPTPPHEVNPEVPHVLSRIILKLLEKSSHQRYQSTWGLICDLKRAHQSWQASGQVDEFEIAKLDQSPFLQITNRLYGREEPLRLLLESFDRTVQGKKEWILIQGEPGIGKSTLSLTLQRPVVHRRGFLANGEFAFSQTNRPFHGALQILGELVKFVLTEPPVKLARWKERLVKVMAGQAGLVTHLIPELEIIVGKTPRLNFNDYQETQNRLQTLLTHLILVFAKQEHPLVLIFDDIQWADVASINLLAHLADMEEAKYCLIVCNYRDQEIKNNPTACALIHKLQKGLDACETIRLESLQHEHVYDLIKDSLPGQETEVGQLTDLILQKTNGNPLFVHEFFKQLGEEKNIHFDLNQHRWILALDKIQNMPITHNVVDLMIHKMQRLSKETQQTLAWASYLGSTFDLAVLSDVLGIAQALLYDHLQAALQDGLIIPQGHFDVPETERFSAPFLISRHKFAHDRIHEAAYTLIPPAESAVAHLRIARCLSLSQSALQWAENPFIITDHFNQAATLLSEIKEIIEFTHLNILAAQRSKENSDFKYAENYLTFAGLFRDRLKWDDDYDLLVSYYRELVETHYLSGKFQAAEKFALDLIAHQKTENEKAETSNHLIILYTMSAQYDLGTKVGAQALHGLGVDLPLENLEQAIINEHEKVKQLLAKAEIASLSQLPAMTSPTMRIAMRVLTNMGPLSFFSNMALFTLIVLKRVQICLNFGHVVESSSTYATYGLLLGKRYQDYKRGFAFGQLALEVCGKWPSLRQKCKVYYLFGTFLSSWTQPIKQSLTIFKEGYQAGSQSGEIQYAGYCLYQGLANRYYLGHPLAEILAQAEHTKAFLEKSKDEGTLDSVIAYAINIRSMRFDTFDSALQHWPIVDEWLPQAIQRKSLDGLCRYYLNLAQVEYLLGNFLAALQAIEKARSHLNMIIGTIPFSEFNFYEALILIEMIPLTKDDQQRQLIDLLEKDQEQNKHWQQNCPENYNAKFLLVEAEMSRLFKRTNEARDLYDQAIFAAKEQGFLHLEALANEKAGCFWLQQGREDFAQLYLARAYYTFDSWGFTAKLKQLKESYPLLLNSIKGSTPQTLKKALDQAEKSKQTSQQAMTANGEGNWMDLLSVLKASQSLSREIELLPLLQSMMKIFIENAGAQKGLMLMEESEKWMIKAYAALGQNDVRLFNQCAVGSGQARSLASHLVDGIIHYVSRTKLPLVIHDASRERDFIHNEHLKNLQAKSILCLPLLFQNDLKGIVYLENNLSSGAFTQDRLEVLQLLASQVAISLENARLYQTLRKREEQYRTLVENLNVGLYRNTGGAQGQFLQANSACARIFGYDSVSEFLKVPISSFYANPEERLQFIDKVKRDGHVKDIEIKMRKRDGSSIYVSVSATAIFDESGEIKWFDGMTEDVTEKRANAEKLQKLNQAYERFVPREFLKYLNKESILQVKLGDNVQRVMTILFADIRSFTTLSESFTPAENFRFINDYLNQMGPIVRQHAGHIDKYLGDGIMALFNNPDDAVEAALAMLKQLAHFNQQRLLNHETPIRIGIGLNTGSLMLGTVGDEERMEGTVISDAVNLASRLEGINKLYGTSLLISESTFYSLQNPQKFNTRFMGCIKVKGKAATVNIFNLVYDEDLDHSAQKNQALKLFESAVGAYFVQDFTDSERLFRTYLKLVPHDLAAEFYLKQAQRYLHSGADEHWDDLYHLASQS